MKMKKHAGRVLALTLLLAWTTGMLLLTAKVHSKDAGYIKNPKKPTYLYVISQNSMTPAEKTMIATLQGLVAGHSTVQIYTLDSHQPDYQLWLDDLKKNKGVSYEMISDPWALLDVFKTYVKGYVLYSKASEKDPSINNACSLSGLKRCIAIDASIEPMVKKHGITHMAGDCRNTDKYWAYNTLWRSGLNHSTVIELSPDKPIALRDYAVMTKALVFYEDAPKKTALRSKVFAAMNNGAVCLGWGPDEFINVSTASKYGVSMIAADWSYNLTVLSAFPSLPVSQKPQLTPPAEADVHYVTFIMSDGDNQQWTLGSNFSSPKWYGFSNRGQFNMGWSISPSMYYLAPTVLDMYYKSAAAGTYHDNFIVSPSGNGYIYPSMVPPDKLTLYTKDLNDYMKKVDQRYVSVMDDWALEKTDVWDKFTAHSNIEGLFYLNYSKQNDYHGKIIWSNNKPIVSCRNLLWAQFEDEDALVDNINNEVTSGHTNVGDASAYSFVYVHAWSKTMSNVQNVVDRLNQNPKVRIVTPEAFMSLVKTNLKPEKASK